MPIKRQTIAVVGSTGSIGKSTLKVLEKYPKLFKVELLICNVNFKKLETQVKKFLPKYLFINDVEKFKYISKIKFKKKINVLKNFDDMHNTFLKKKKFDKVILCVPSLEGLKYAFNFIEYSKEILIANKESIVCGGKILLRKAKLYNCKITSIDSEHYCLSELLNITKLNFIDSVYLTASGGPFLDKKKKYFLKSSIKKVLNHPNWTMGKKISVDSATMVNKIFEIIEAHVLFNIPIKKIKIKIHKESLVHSAIVLKNGVVKFIMHDTSMLIPIRNCLFDNNYFQQKNNFFVDNKNFALNFDEGSLKQFDIIKPALRVINLGHAAWILFNVVNDQLVDKFLKKEIFFYEISQNLIKIFSNKNTILYCRKKIKNFHDILKTISYGKTLMNK